MASDGQPVEQVSELLHNLKVDSQTNVGDTLEVASGDASDGALEASVSSGFSDISANAYEGYFDAGIYYAGNYYTMPHGFYYGGYEYPVVGWDSYSQRAATDGLDAHALGNDFYGVYNENGTMLYHAGGFEYTQPLYGPYSPGAPILTNGQLYGPAYPYPGHMYQQPVASGLQFISSASAVLDVPSSATDSNNSVVDGTKGPLINENNITLGPKPPCPVTSVPSAGPYMQTTLPTSVSMPVSQDGRSGIVRSDGSKSAEGQQRHTMSQVLSVTGPYGQTMQAGSRMQSHMSAGQPCFPSLSGAYRSPARAYSSFSSARGQGLGFNGFGPRGNGYAWMVEKGTSGRGRGGGSISNGSGNLDALNEQNRGPRTSRTRNQHMLPGSFRLIKGQDDIVSGGSDSLGTVISKEQYNRSDFSVNYESAKFFVIKSYTEDDIHKSIKYNVWASTPNGNKKLDAAYQEAQEKDGHCPVFLFFSVNASGQFCGVAEMAGPVDFGKSMDFWQQDKWNGRFPVRWHIIKDVPNNQFRHIILANNDHKPVTNSRDTQEVKFEQGIEMLKLFKNYILKASILDDFQFYENRQRAMQEKRARQLQGQPQHMVPLGRNDESELHKGTSSDLEDVNLVNEQGNSFTAQDFQLTSASAVVSSVVSTDEGPVGKDSLPGIIVNSGDVKSSNASKDMDN